MIKKIIYLSIISLLFYTGCKSYGKIPVGFQAPDENIENRLEAINGTYTLLPPDVIEISVNDNPELKTRAIIRPDGNIFFPLLGDVYVEGLTPLEVREKIHKLLSRYLKELPEESISVMIMGFNSKKIYVNSYGLGIREIPFTGVITVLDAVTKSGMLVRASNKSKIMVIRGEKDSDKKPQKLVLNLNDIIKRGKTASNIVLRPNDIVYIPPTFFGRIGYLAQDILFPTQPVQNLGSAASSAQFNSLGFGGIPSGGEGR
jgi:polysaccharide biosynthesis/export protein